MIDLKQDKIIHVAEQNHKILQIFAWRRQVGALITEFILLKYLGR